MIFTYLTKGIHNPTPSFLPFLERIKLGVSQRPKRRPKRPHHRSGVAHLGGPSLPSHITQLLEPPKIRARLRGSLGHFPSPRRRRQTTDQGGHRPTTDKPRPPIPNHSTKAIACEASRHPPRATALLLGRLSLSSRGRHGAVVVVVVTVHLGVATKILDQTPCCLPTTLIPSLPHQLAYETSVLSTGESSESVPAHRPQQPTIHLSYCTPVPNVHSSSPNKVNECFEEHLSNRDSFPCVFYSAANRVRR